jgi:hypothetical protein
VNFKRILLRGDGHSGHKAGLTPPPWQSLNNDPDPRWAEIRAVLWKHYADIVDRLKPIYCQIDVGDSIDGKGERSGGTEQIVADRNEQVKMAAWGLNYAEAEHNVMVYGTPYHVGRDEDLEDAVADHVKNLDKLGSHEWVEVNGVVFDIKHKVASSAIPYGKGTPIAREWLWNALWAERDMQPRADIIVRGHVHYPYFVGEPGEWYACTLPALQGLGTKFGARQCSGIVKWGLAYVDVFENGEWSIHWESHNIKEQAVKSLVL